MAKRPLFYPIAFLALARNYALLYPLPFGRLSRAIASAKRSIKPWSSGGSRRCCVASSVSIRCIAIACRAAYPLAGGVADLLEPLAYLSAMLHEQVAQGNRRCLSIACLYLETRAIIQTLQCDRSYHFPDMRIIALALWRAITFGGSQSAPRRAAGKEPKAGGAPAVRSGSAAVLIGGLAQCGQCDHFLLCFPDSAMRERRSP